MKKIYFAIAVLATGFLSSGTTFAADNTASANIQAAANVTAAVTVTAGTSLDFKTIMPGVTKTIGLTDNVTAGGVVTGETSGHFAITKGANTQVQLTLSAPATLTGPGTAIPITYTYQLSGETAVAPIAAFPFTVANSGATADYWSATGFAFDLGGTVVPAATQTSGSYAGTVTLTATYN
jgi:hypothetical protein